MTMTTIDCALPVAAPAIADLLPYMEPAWIARFERTHFQLPNGNITPRGSRRQLSASAPATAKETAEALSSDTEAAILFPLQAMPTAGWCDTPICAVFASALNSYFIERWLPVDSRFRLAIAVSPHEADLAVKEIGRLGSLPRVAAIAMPPLFGNLGRAHYYPIFEAAVEHGLPIIIHPSGSEGFAHGCATIGGTGPYRGEERYALLAQVAQANIASLVYDGVFVRFPDLKIVFAGFGFEWAPPLIWKVDQEWRHLRIDIPWITEAPSLTIAKNIRLMIDDIGYAPVDAFRAMITALPNSVLLYGSNAPFREKGGNDLADGIPDEERERIFAGNARDTFRLAA
jgi:predicted TIM-barrel fold metal-dependent hydrolase